MREQSRLVSSDGGCHGDVCPASRQPSRKKERVDRDGWMDKKVDRKKQIDIFVTKFFYLFQVVLHYSEWVL